MSKNIIRIKRRIVGDPGSPTSLLNGELAYNEVNHVLYYGASASIEAIAGRGMFVDRVTNQTISGEKTFEDKAFFNDDVDILQNTTIYGNLSVLGDITTIDTFLLTTSAVEIQNSGTGPALKATQTGNQDIAIFYDDTDCALSIKDGGNVGVGTFTPNEALTVIGSISATDALTIEGVSTLNGAVTINNTLNVTDAVDFDSTLNVDGSTTINDTLSVTGAVDFDSTFNVDGSTTLNSSLVVQGSTTINNTLSVTDDVTFDKALNIIGDTTINGILSVIGDVRLDSTLDVDGSTTLNNTLSVIGEVDFDSSLNILGVTTIHNTLSVVDAVNFDSTFTAQGATTLGDTLNVTGVTDISSDLYVAGTTTLRDTLSVVGIANFDSTLTVLSSTTLADTLDVTGDVDLGSNLNVIGITTLDNGNITTNGAGNITLTGDISAYGSLTVDSDSLFKSNLTVTNNLTANDITANNISLNSDAYITGNLTVYGNLTALGDNTVIETTTTVASAFSITNAGSQTALTVTQKGAQDVAAFFDGELIDPTLIIKDGGRVGINTSEPSTELTVAGSISASGNVDINGTLSVTNAVNFDSTLDVVGITTLDNSTIYTDGAGSMTVTGSITAVGNAVVAEPVNSNHAATKNYVDSGDTSLLTTVHTVSTNLDTKITDLNTTVYANSANWDSVYSNVNANSGSWQDTNSSVYANSANWDSVYSNVNATSAENATRDYVYSTYLPLSGGTVAGSLCAVGVHVIEANSASPALRITQTGLGHALRVEDSVNPDSSPFVITSGGQVGIGTTNPSFISGFNHGLHIKSTTNTGTELRIDTLDGNRNSALVFAASGGGQWRIFNNTSDNNSFNIQDLTQPTIVTALTIIDGGSVGIATTSPNERLTVKGNISASGTVYTSSMGNSQLWNDAYTNLVTNSAAYLSGVDLSFLSVSANWDSTYTSVKETSANWDSVYSTVQSKSATGWDNSLANSYTHLNFLPLSGGTLTGKLTTAANNTSSKLNIGNAIADPAPTIVENGDIWITSGNRLGYRSNSVNYSTAQTNLQNSFNQAQIVDASTTIPAVRITQRGTGESLRVEDETTPDSSAFIVGSGGNVGIGLSSLAGINAKLTVVGNVSATGSYYGDGSQLTGIVAGGDTVATTLVRANSANWDSTYTSVKETSANWDSVYSNVNANSAQWASSDTDLVNLTGNWESTYSAVQTNSAYWNEPKSDVRLLSANWEDTYSIVLANSAQWASNDTDLVNLTGSWQDTNSSVYANSANWDSTYSNVNANSANAVSVYSNVRANSANAVSVYSNVNANSATNWNNSIARNYTHTNFLPITGGTITGGLTANGIHSTLDFTIGAGAAVLYVDSFSVGINTEDPTQALTVAGSISASGTLMYGVTSTAPVNATTPVGWVDVVVGDIVYKLPLYQ
jgi:cytoskeletal protein CcmA (bactofilin family)